MKRKYIVAWFLAVALTSCSKDFLNVVPETLLSSATFFKTEADFQQAVNGAYVPFRQMYNERAWVLEEMHSDNTYYARNPLYGLLTLQKTLLILRFRRRVALPPMITCWYSTA